MLNEKSSLPPLRGVSPRTHEGTRTRVEDAHIKNFFDCC